MKVNFAPLKGALKLTLASGSENSCSKECVHLFDDVTLADFAICGVLEYSFTAYRLPLAAYRLPILQRAFYRLPLTAYQFCSVQRAACSVPILPPTSRPIWVQALPRKAGAGTPPQSGCLCALRLAPLAPLAPLNAFCSSHSARPLTSKPDMKGISHLVRLLDK